MLETLGSNSCPSLSTGQNLSGFTQGSWEMLPPAAAEEEASAGSGRLCLTQESPPLPAFSDPHFYHHLSAESVSLMLLPLCFSFEDNDGDGAGD